MQEILNKLNEAYELCLAKSRELTELIARANETAQQQKELADKLSEREKSLNTRESAVKNIEDVAKFHTEAQQMLQQGRDSLTEAEKRIQNFSQYENATKEDLRHKEEALAKKEGMLAEKETNLEALILEKVKSILKK